MHALPLVMVRNEERFIAAVLRPLVACFPHVLVGDTGSTDGTLEIVRAMPNVKLIEYGPQTPTGLREVRQALTDLTQRMGADWALLVDGDELYAAAALRDLLAQEMPSGKQIGFTNLLSVEQDAEGTYWELDDLFNRQALQPATARWHGDYPFEAPDLYGDPTLYHYFNMPPGFRYHAVHLHRLQRSAQDASVFMRQQKQHQFSLVARDVKRTQVFDLESWQNA